MTRFTIDDGGGADRPATRPTGTTYRIAEGELPSEAVVRATASLTDTSVTELAPLYDVVDPVHLDGLFDDSSDGTDPGVNSVTFEFDGCHVTVTGEAIVVRRAESTG